MNNNLKPSSFPTHHQWYSATLNSLTTSSDSDSDSDSLLLYTYTAYHGFAASLTPSQSESLHRSDSVLGVFRDTLYSLHTTRTPEFLGLDPQLGLWAGHTPLQLNQASQDVVVGVLDTGVWSESKSFDDSGMPAKWKGECKSGPDFKPTLCNKKLIGARRFSRGYHMASGSDPKVKQEIDSPRDYDGHGTHTSSAASGAHVANASLLGYASGTARGMAINARWATYKICWKTGCFGSDILAGMDRANLDGVDVLSLSLGGGSNPYYRDKGIFVSCSAGNSGPGKGSLAKVAPWIMTVRAGTIDRDFPAYAVMGDGKRFTRVSNSGKRKEKKPPLISGTDPTVAIFASAALPVKRPLEWSEGPSCCGPACGCSPSCKCDPECHCEGL